MSGFGHYDRTAAEIEQAIAIRGIQIGLDWTDSVQVRALAREALDSTPEGRLAMLRNRDASVKARGTLFALSALMLDILRQSAQVGAPVSGGRIWKAFESALHESSLKSGKQEAGRGEQEAEKSEKLRGAEALP
ncbi:MAG: hypothetical protein LBU45_01150 [Azoarcus sp.]|jgi:hypothetical protein|nr:hypothetical protein [Azoarcus sp.]